MILAPIILVLFVILFLFSCVANSATQQTGSSVSYDEDKFQAYADRQYAAEFGDSSAYEDNLLITVLVEDDCYDYWYIAWVGDHIATDINYLFGGNSTELGQAMDSCINASSYRYSLDSNLAQVMETMTKEIIALELESSFKCTEDHAQVKSHLTNHSSLDLTESTVNDALTAFTDATGIPAVIVVADMDDVFGATAATTASGTSSISPVAIVVLVVVVGVVLVVMLPRKRNDVDEEFRTDER